MIVSTESDLRILKLDQSLLNNLYRHASIKNYACNEVLYQKGDTPHNLYIFLSGQMKISRTKEEIMHCFTGELVGIDTNFTEICYPESIQFLSPGQMFVIPFNSFKAILMQQPKLLDKIVDGLLKKKKIIIPCFIERLNSYKNV